MLAEFPETKTISTAALLRRRRRLPNTLSVNDGGRIAGLGLGAPMDIGAPTRSRASNHPMTSADAHLQKTVGHNGAKMRPPPPS